MSQIRLLKHSAYRALKNKPLRLPLRRPGGGALPEANLLAHFDDTTIIGDVTGWGNKVGGGGAFDLDTVVGVGANLHRLESGWGRVPGPVVSNFFQTSDIPGTLINDISADVLVHLRDLPIGPDSYTLFARDDNGVGNRGLALFLQDDGTLFFASSTDGTTFDTLAFSTVAIVIDPTQPVGIRVERDNATGVVNFATNVLDFDNPADWVALGTPVAGVAGTIFNNNLVVTVGAQFPTDVLNILKADIQRVKISEDPDSTVIYNFDTRDASSPTADWTDGLTGINWNVQGNSYVNTSAFPVVLADGNVNLATTEIGAPVIVQPLTIFVVAKKEASQGVAEFIMDSITGDRVNLQYPSGGSNLVVNAGVSLAIGVADPNGVHVFAAVVDGADSSVDVDSQLKAEGDAGLLDMTFGNVFANTGDVNNLTGWIGEIAIFSGVLSQADYDQAFAFLEGKWK